MTTKAYLEADEVRRLEEVARYLRDRLLVRLLFRLGCRISEALDISADDIDFSQGTITIKHLKMRIKLACPHCRAKLTRSCKFCPECGLEVKTVVAEEKKHHRLRTLPVDSDTLEMLKEYIERGGPVSQDGKQLLFGITRQHAWQIIKNLARKAGLPMIKNTETGRIRYVSPHRLREAFAVNAVQQDSSTDGIRMLQEMLGHAKIGTTLRYRRIAGQDGQELKEWYRKLWG